jgi:hypothetical protein
MYPTTYCPRPWPERSGSPTDATTPSLPDRITADNCVLLFVDCQVGPLWDFAFGMMRRRMGDLAESAFRAGVPVVASALDLENRGPVIPELFAGNPGVIVVNRSVANAWNDDAVRAAVRESGRSLVVVIGSAAELCVALCAMSAAVDGLGVYAVFEMPGVPSRTARWFGDRLVVATCALIASAIETSATSRSRPDRRNLHSRISMHG